MDSLYSLTRDIQYHLKSSITITDVFWKKSRSWGVVVNRKERKLKCSWYKTLISRNRVILRIFLSIRPSSVVKRTRSYTFFDTILLSLDDTCFSGCVVIGIGLKGWLGSWTSTKETENDFYVFIRSSQYDTHRKWEQHKRPIKQQDNKKKEVQWLVIS